jgi:tetrahydromethanopterin S-methyltransferase subunit B
VAFPVCDCHSTDPKLPDDCSDDLTVYYIAEWNGTSWVYTIVNVGYTVVVLENGIPTEYIVTINPDTGDAELVTKDNDDQIIADIEQLKSDLSELDSIIGDYASDKGTIAERLDAIENKLDVVESKLNNWLDFNDRNNNDIDEPKIPYDKDEDGGGDGIKVGVDEEGENIYW